MNNQGNILIDGKLKHDQRTFRILFETYHAPLFRFAETYVCCPGLAEDIVQEIFIKLWENKDLRINGSLRSYLFLMVRNRCIDYLRTLKLEDKKKQKLMEAQILSDSVDLDFDDEVKGKIKKAIRELPEQCRQVYEMSIYDGLKHAEIAEELNISISAVKVQVFRAKKNLREALYNIKELLLLFAGFVSLKKVHLS
ncbi:RNA polymerase sigma-70 factor [Ancylomarina sp. 16SWW S1-10-2]|uniref:RNA polymerase sigma-70 factor n=1 Tax=Ancylomarina sp. 16SWW S1-10-2 TaxID=2499681 RepID=UPI0012AD6A77|nr:RNA polymerase sigma-70 factor [Ancylomarina sp. 16SWW S1-10-2]MRT93241.1 RNA polymerase sigma-70 factor [Ancylomarina sp. 16SWW S1-10-2]